MGHKKRVMSPEKRMKKLGIFRKKVGQKSNGKEFGQSRRGFGRKYLLKIYKFHGCMILTRLEILFLRIAEYENRRLPCRER